jgi:SAM-dependent methyltransferase
MPPVLKPDFVGPADNFPLSSADLTAAFATCDTMVALRQGRAAYMQQRGLDPQLWLPAHMWGQNFVASNFDKVVRKDAHTLNHLRCLTYNFTGFSLLTMAPCENTPEVLEVPVDADARIRAQAGRCKDAAVEFVRSTQQVPLEQRVTTPRLCGESGWDVDGAVVNFDTWSCQQRLNGLRGSGVLDLVRRRAAPRGYARVLEIGAGFGNLAYNLQQQLGPTDYVVVDLPESMVYSAVWLGAALPDQRHTVAAPGRPLPAEGPGVTFVANHLLDEFQDQLGSFDLVVNVMSLSEMAPAQVAEYGRRVAALLGPGGVFYEQNYLVPGVHTDVVGILGQTFGYGAQLEETAAPHRGRGTARLWANGYCRELWDRGGVRPLPTCVSAARDVVLPARPQHVSITDALAAAGR